MSGRHLENTLVRLLKKRPFYGHLAVGLRKSDSNAPHPLGVTIREGVPTLTVNDHLFSAQSPDTREALVEHCIRHLLHLHPFRRKERNRHDWDLACDLALNDSIENLPPGSPKAGQLSLPTGLAAEEYYRLLVDPFDCGSMPGKGAGDADKDTGDRIGPQEKSTSHAPLDDHTVWDEANGTPLRLAEEMVRGAVRDAYRKADGEIPPEIRPLVREMMAPSPIPWRMLLRQFIATAGRIGRQSTWQRENRRFAHAAPGIRKRHRLNLLIGVDVSDSTNAPQLREAFARELLRIARGRDTLLSVLYANSRVQRIDSFKGNNAVCESYHGGGFTDLRPVFAHARNMRPLPAAVIYLTDGIGPAPEKMEFPTLWVLTREGEKPVPWGVELRLDI
jgi:predicted metal-dependent peptidase